MNTITAMSAAAIVGSELKKDDAIPFLVEVELIGNPEDQFLKVKETLTRIGVASQDGTTLYQTCHLLSKRQTFFICSFKTLYVLDGYQNTITLDDIARQNRIIKMLEDWNMIRVVQPHMITYPMSNLAHIKVVKYAEKDTWNLKPKYIIGSKNKHPEMAA